MASWRQEKERVLIWVATGLLGLLGVIVGAVAWADHAQVGDNTSAVRELKANTGNDHEAIQEIRQDVRDIKNHLMEKK